VNRIKLHRDVYKIAKPDTQASLITTFTIVYQVHIIFFLIKKLI